MGRFNFMKMIILPQRTFFFELSETARESLKDFPPHTATWFENSHGGVKGKNGQDRFEECGYICGHRNALVAGAHHKLLDAGEPRNVML